VSEPMRYDAWVLMKGKQGVIKKQHDSPLLFYLSNNLYNFHH
jgi:hypothetical protein